MQENEQNEEQRLKALYGLNLLYTPSEERFNRILDITTKIFNVPVAVISLLDENKEWFKAKAGLNISEVPRNSSIADLILKSPSVFVSENTNNDTRVQGMQLVTGQPRLGFLAGVALSTPDGSRVGAFYIGDTGPRQFTDIDRKLLSDISNWAQIEILRNIQLFEEKKKEREVQEELVMRNRELEEERARHKAMLENIGDGVIGINDKGEIIFMNEQVERLLGWKEGETVGKLLVRVVPMVDEEDNEIQVFDRPIRNALFTKKKVVNKDNYYLRKDGSKFPVAVTATPVVVYDRVIGGVNVFRDITKEKEVDRMKTEFISLASHQLRTPLSAMKWFCEILIDGDTGELNDEQMEMLNNIYQSNERMIELVNTLLNISRIESGRIIIDPVPTDLKKLVDEVILEIRPKLDKKKQELVFSVHEGLPKINIDPKLIRHVYMNLLTNAVKYTKEGGEIVVIISRSGDEVISQVSDNGFGIPKDQHDKVFKKFFRAENIVKIETEGTGLGLYLTKSIVESSGGKIWFESEEGKGTTFWFALPVSGSKQKEGEVSIDV